MAELPIDRGYLPATFVEGLYVCGTEVVANPWSGRREGRFGKADFRYDLRAQTVVCPAGETTSWQPDHRAVFEAQTCADCHLRERCTTAKATGRTAQMGANEVMHEKLRRKMRTRTGRARRRERVVVQNAQAHLVARQGNRSPYFGQRKNLLDVRCCAAVQNLHTCLLFLDRQVDEDEQAAA